MMLTAEQKAFWEDNGYLILPKWYSEESIQQLDTFNNLWYSRPDRLTVDDLASGERMLLKDAPATLRFLPYKLNDVYLESPTLRSQIGSEALGAILSELTGGPLAICNSLHFERGSEQELHTDLFYMPGRNPNGLIATWTCLEDVSPDAGPLSYFPGSHKIASPFNYYTTPPDERISRVFEAMDYYQTQYEILRLDEQYALCKKGDVFIWHEKLLHCGAAIWNMSLTRKSIVTHYWKRFECPGHVLRMNNHMSWYVRGHQPVSATTPGVQRK